EDRLPQLRGSLLRQPACDPRAPRRPPRPRARVARRPGARRRLPRRHQDRRPRRPGRPRAAGLRRPARGQHPHRARLGEATRHDVPPDLARDPAQAHPPRRAVGTGGAAGAVGPRHRPVGRAAVPERREHAAAGRRVRLPRAARGDRLPPQRRTDGAWRRGGPRPDPGRHGPHVAADRGALRPDVARPGGVRRQRSARAAARRRGAARGAARRRGGAGPGAQHGDRSPRERTAAGCPRRQLPPRHPRPLPGRRRARDRLQLGHVRLRDHRQAHRAVRTRPRGVRRHAARLLLRPRAGRPRAAHDLARGARRCPRRPARGGGRSRRCLHGVPLDVLLARGRSRHRPGAGAARAGL
ncbi:MAG: CDP-glycerol:poly(glycerophosphate) glycerophosphotransferase, partial [uncultured Nocardioidaceae bacterium]